MSEALDKLKAWLAENRQNLLDQGVDTITGTYYGSGDQGSFDGIQVEPIGSDYRVPDDVEELIEAVSDEVAPPGYETNDGGGGNIILRIEENKIVHESYYNQIVQTDESPKEL